MPTKPKKGFRCANCRTPLGVTHTRARANGIVSRRRRCPSCGLVVQTEERPKQSAGH